MGGRAGAKKTSSKYCTIRLLNKIALLFVLTLSLASLQAGAIPKLCGGLKNFVDSRIFEMGILILETVTSSLLNAAVCLRIFIYKGTKKEVSVSV